MSAPPRQLVRLVIVLVALGSFLAWDQTREWPAHVNADSSNYVRNYVTRGWVYPLLIDLVVPQSQQNFASWQWGWTQRTAPEFERLVLVQRLIMLAALAPRTHREV